MTTGWRVSAVLALGVAVTGAPLSAAHHHHHHAPTSRHATARKTPRHDKPARHDKAATRHADPAPKGVTTVPAGGIKLFCGPGRNPLLIRKMTQGAGTTVTVVCR